jgi:hypothetical protein
MTGAVSAFYFVGYHHTIGFDPYGVPYLCRRFIGTADQIDGACGTNFGAFGTFGAAIASFVRHLRLHPVAEFLRRQ